MIRSYLAERFSPRTFVPLAVVIAAAASDGTRGGARLGIDAVYALLLLAQFRAWDDLADRERDALAHQTRVLVRAASIAPVVALSVALTILNLALAVRRDESGIAIAMLLALIAALAARQSLRTSRTAAGDLLLLAKYPAMVIIVAGARILHAPAPMLSAALALFLAVCLYEAWHDPASPLAIGGRR
jgi:hypothetical protein